MKSLLLSGIFLGVAFGLTGCANSASSASNASESVAVSSDSPKLRQPAQYVFDPIKNEYYWERDGLPVASQYD